MCVREREVQIHVCVRERGADACVCVRERCRYILAYEDECL